MLELVALATAERLLAMLGERPAQTTPATNRIPTTTMVVTHDEA